MAAPSTTRTTDVIVIGGGQAGPAASPCPADRGVDHVMVERGDTANSWRTERWDSLRLLTPNWMSRLPGWAYRGTDPDGYTTAAEMGSGRATRGSIPLCSTPSNPSHTSSAISTSSPTPADAVRDGVGHARPREHRVAR